MSKNAVLDEAMKHIEKQFGKGAIMKLGENKNMGLITTFHAGSYLMDIVLGGGFPEGRVVEIYGPESSGKTTTALHAIAEVQKKWEIAAFIDAEHALDVSYAKQLGVDTENLLLSQPDYGEQALQIVEELAKTGAIKLIVVDSVAALTPRAEIEGDMGDSHMGLQARMMSQWLRKLTGILSKTGTTVIFINQLRHKIGVMFGNPETTTGWQALKFYASQRIEVRKGEKIEKNKEEVGHMIKIKVVKNKVAPPFKKCEIPVLFGVGFDREGDLVEAGMLLGLITRAGAYYSIGDEKFQWKEALITFLTNANSDIATRLEQEIQAKIKEIRIGKIALPEEINVKPGEDEEESDEE
jgi:recombination protein RecA